MKTMDPFAVLGVEPGASMKAIRQAWLDNLQVWHPDRFNKVSSIYATASERTKLINAAYDTLKASGGAAPPPQAQSGPEEEEVNWDDEPGPFTGGTTGPIGFGVMPFVIEFGGEVWGFMFVLIKHVFDLLFFHLRQLFWPLVVAALCMVADLRRNRALASAKPSPTAVVFSGTQLTAHPTPLTPRPTPLRVEPTLVSFLPTELTFLPTPLTLDPVSLAPRARPLAPRATPLISSATPVIPHATPMIRRAEAVIPRAIPVIPRAIPVIPRAMPLAPRAMPLAPRAIPVAPCAAPLAPCAAPLAPRLEPRLLESHCKMVPWARFNPFVGPVNAIPNLHPSMHVSHGRR